MSIMFDQHVIDWIDVRLAAECCDKNEDRTPLPQLPEWVWQWYGNGLNPGPAPFPDKPPVRLTGKQQLLLGLRQGLSTKPEGNAR